MNNFGCKTCGMKWSEANITLLREEAVCPCCKSDDVDEIIPCPFCGLPQYRESVEAPADYCHHDI